MSPIATTFRRVSVVCGVLLFLLPIALSAQTIEVLHSFSGCGPTGCVDADDGSHPQSTLVLGPDGYFYGTTVGIAAGSGTGTIFKIAPNGAMTTLFTFRYTEPPASAVCPHGCFPVGTLAYADGAFYGVTTVGGLYGDGTLFKITSDGSFTKLHDFDVDGNPQNNGGPQGGLVRGPDGKFYGTSQYSGMMPLTYPGFVFRLETDGTITILHYFSGSDGQWPQGDLMLASDGNIYGTTLAGGGGGGNNCNGNNGCGTVFRVRPSGVVEMVHAFDGVVGGDPVSGLIQGADGNLYGTGLGGGVGCGTAYRMTLDGTVTVLHAFAMENGGCVPRAALVPGIGGDLFGTTAGGVGGHKGSVYQLTPSGAATALHNFLGPEGSRPFGGLVQDSDGYLYGTTSDGGDHNLGVVFRLALPARNGTLDVVEDTPKNGTLTATYPNGSLMFSIVSNGALGTATITDAQTGAFTYTPNANANGDDSFTFKANNGTVDSNVATVTITITPVNDAPVATDGTASTTFGTPVSGGLVATDVENSALTYAIVANGTSGSAAITNAATGTYLYTPNAGASGSDTFTFKANDGTSDSNVATVTVTISGNSPPVASDGTLSPTEDTAAGGTLQATDPEGHALTFSIVSNGSKGTALITNQTTGAYTYTPNPNVNGADSFTFRVNDGTIDSNVATVTITITGVNDAPTAQAGNLTTNEDTAASATLVAVDVEGDTLAFSIVTNGTKGTAVITNPATGAYTYTPNLNTNGADSFTFKVNDDVADSNVSTVTIAITAVNDAPNAVNGTLSTASNRAVSGTLVATDVDGPSLNFIIVTNGTQGVATITNPATGAVTYLPNQNAIGSDTFTFRANDGAASSNVATISVTIAAVNNDAPIATNNSYTTNANTTLIVAAPGVLGNDSDANSDPLTAVLSSAPAHGTLTLSSNGAFSYTPATNYSGPDSFTYRASDGAATSNIANVSLTVTTPVLVLSPTSLAFSNQLVGTSSPPRLVVLTNTGNGVMTIGGISMIGVNATDFSQTTTCGPTVPAGASCNIDVVFRPSATGTRAASLQVSTNAGGPGTVALSGTGTGSSAVLSPTHLTFGTYVIGTTSPIQTATLRNVGTVPLFITSRYITGDQSSDFAFAKVGVDEGCTVGFVGPGDSCRVYVTFTPTRTGKGRAGDVHLVDSTGAHHVVYLSGTGTRSLVTFTPTTLAFGVQLVGVTSPTQQAIVSNTGARVRLSAIAASGDFAIATTTCGSTLAGGATCVINVRFTPTRRGDRTGTLSLRADGTRHTLGLSGFGIRP